MIIAQCRALLMALVVSTWVLSTSILNAKNENQESAVGTNLSYFKSWSASWTLVDVAPRLRAWSPGGPDSFDVCNTTKPDKTLCNNGAPLQTDALGWPVKAHSNNLGTVKPRTMMFEDLGGRYPDGEYVILWEGSGEIRFSGAVSPEVTLRGVGTAATPFRGVFTVPRGKTLPVQVTVEDIGESAGNTIRNIRILVPGGVTGTVDSAGRITDVDPFGFCDDLPRRSNGVSTLKTGTQCIDFEHVAYNRFKSDADGSELSPAKAVAQGKVIFHPQFLSSLKKYRSIRFMDWMETNDSPVSSWSDRTKVRDQTFTGASGIPPAYCIALSNALHADPWFTMPHLSTDDYNRKFAQLVDAQLEPGRKVHIEYSNETWNAGFKQNAWILDQGANRGLPGDRYQRGHRYHSERTVEIATIWRNQLQARGDDLKIVMGSQAFNSYVSDIRLSWNNASRVVDELSIAPYFARYFGDPRQAAVVRNMSVETVFKEIFEGGVLDNAPANGSLEDARKSMRDNALIASKHGVTMTAYEGGQHLAGYAGTQNDDRITELFLKVNAHPRMADAYRRYLSDWRESGGQLFVHFTHLAKWSKWGSWGATQYQTDNPSTSPKLRTLMNFVGTSPCWWSSCSLNEGNTSGFSSYLSDAESVNNSTVTDSTVQPIRQPSGGLTEDGSSDADPAVDAGADNSNNDVVADPVPSTPRTRPLRLTFEMVENGIQLLWNGTRNEGLTYHLRRWNAQANQYDVIGSTMGLSFIDENVNSSESYTYVVSFSDNGVESDLSSPFSVNYRQPASVATCDAPQTNASNGSSSSGGQPDTNSNGSITPPRQVRARVSGNAIKISWKGATNEGITYFLYRSEEGRAFRRVGFTGGDNYLDRNVKANVVYHYAVSAKKGGTESSRSNESSVTVGNRTHRVASVQMSLSRSGRRSNNWDGKARVQIQDENGKAVANAIVRASWWAKPGSENPQRIARQLAVTDKQGFAVFSTKNFQSRNNKKIRLRVDRVERKGSAFNRRTSHTARWVSPGE